MKHHLAVYLLCLFSVSLCAQRARLQSGCWQDAEGRLFNCYADSFQVAIMSLSRTDKLLFEGRWRGKGQIEGQLLHVDFRTDQHTRTRATLAQKNLRRLDVVAGGVLGSGFSPGKVLRHTTHSTRYLPLTQPIFDQRWRAWERKNWFQFADTLVQIFTVNDIAHYEKTVLYPNGTGQGIRYRLMEYGCQNREKVQYTVQNNGEIRFKLAHMDNACDGYAGLSAQGSIRSNYSVDGFIGPNDDMPPEAQRWRIPELKNLGLTGWWPADGHCRDLVTGVAGTLVGGTAYMPGRFGHAFSLDGLNDHVDFPHNPAHQPTRITVLAWIKGRRSTLDLDFLVVDTQHGFGDHSGWMIQGGNRDGWLGFGYGVLGKKDFQGVNGQRDVLDNRWHLIAGTFDGTDHPIARIREIIRPDHIALRATGLHRGGGATGYDRGAIVSFAGGFVIAHRRLGMGISAHEGERQCWNVQFVHFI